MTKHKVAKKKPSRLKKFAAKAMKLVKSSRKPARKSKPMAKLAAKPVVRPAAKPATSLRNSGKSGIVMRASSGKPHNESEIRRMPESAYMNGVQIEFFRQRLLQMRAEVVNREVDVKERLHQRESFADPADRATAEEEHWLDLRLRERESLLLRKIDESLQRIREREYGFCEVTGEPIGIPRLLARPTATVCVDVKGQNEQIESQFRDR